jgi:serine/threonine-protein kinase
MAYAHSRGVIHRDLKPANVMVGAFGEVQVMDWGLAKVLDREDRCDKPSGDGTPEARPGSFDLPVRTVRTANSGPVSQVGEVLGTPAYMAPEQAAGDAQRIDERCDVFALGAMLCELLTGQPPYSGTDHWRVLHMAIRADLAETYARLAACGADPELIRLARSCLAADAADRPRDAGVLAAQVTAYRESIEARLKHAELAEAEARARAAEERKRLRLTVALAAALLLVVVAGGGGAWLLQQQRAEVAARQRETDEQMLQALGRARQQLADGWRAFDLVKLKEARAAADRLAGAVPIGEPAEEVRQQAEEFQAEARQRVARAEKSRALLVALLDVADLRETLTYARDKKGRIVAPAQVSRIVALRQDNWDTQYQAAFRQWGLNVDATTVAEAVARLKDEPDPVLQEVIAGLDGWMLERRRWRMPEEKWRHLFQLAEQLDRSDRRQLRALLIGGAPPSAASVAALLGSWPPWPALWELGHGNRRRRLQELRHRMDPATEPVLSVVLFARACNEVGDLAGATEVLRQALAARPDQVLLRSELGLTLEWHEPAKAIECYQAARALRPRLGIRLVLLLVQVGRAAEAEDVCRDLIGQQPNNPELHFCLGNAQYMQGKRVKAIASFREALRLKGDFPVAHDNLGVALHNQGELVAAVAAYREAVWLRPDFTTAYYHLGHALLDQGKLAEAVTAYRAAIALEPGHAEARSGLGLALHRQGKLAEAVAACREAIRVKPDLAEAHGHLGLALRDQGLALRDQGLALRDQGKLAEAVAACREAIRLKPNLVEAQEILGTALAAQGKLAEAIATFRKVLRQKPNDAGAHNNLARVLAEHGQFIDAVAACKEALRLKPDYAEAYINLGNALAEQRELVEAIAAYRKAIHFKPGYPEAHNNLGVAFLKLGKLSEAEAACREAIRLKPGYPEAHSNLGNALADQGKQVEAAAAYRKAIRLRPDYAEAYINLGNVLGEQGKFRTALAALRQGHRLGASRRGWPTGRSAALVRQAERLVQLERDLPAFLTGKRKPAGPDEQLELASLCGHPAKRLYAAAAHFSADAFAARPGLMDNLQASHRYQAACFAALAGCGRGEDAADLAEKQRSHWREQARQWLRADLIMQADRLKSGNLSDCTKVLETMDHWLADADLAGVRGTQVIDRLPAEEREGWANLWKDVESLHQKARAMSK